MDKFLIPKNKLQLKTKSAVALKSNVEKPATSGNALDQVDVDDENMVGCLASQSIVYKEVRKGESNELVQDVVTPSKLKRKFPRAFESDLVIESPETLMDAWLKSERDKLLVAESHSDESYNGKETKTGRPRRAASPLSIGLPLLEKLHRLKERNSSTEEAPTKVQDTTAREHDMEAVTIREDSIAAPSLRQDQRSSESMAEEEDNGLFSDPFFDEAFENFVQECEEKKLSLGKEQLKSSPSCSSQRLLVSEVQKQDYSLVVRGTTQVFSGDSSEVVVELEDDWASATVEAGDIMTVVFANESGFDSNEPLTRRIVVNRDQNFAIVNPDILLSGTVVSQGFSCSRKAILQDSTRSVLGQDSQPALRGKLGHILFQIGLKEASRTKHVTEQLKMLLQGKVDEIVTENLSALYGAQLGEAEAKSYLLSLVSGILEFISYYFIDTSRIERLGKGENSNLSISKVPIIEESVWSPTFGLKGKIDATMEITLDSSESKISALEFKTGRASGGQMTFHKAQLLIYSLLLSDRYDMSVTNGVLTYISGNNTAAGKDNLSQDGQHSLLVSSNRAELVGIVMKRNELAKFMSSTWTEENESGLPPLLRNRESVCQKCYAVDSCMLQNRMLEGNSALSDQAGPGAALHQLKTGHITDLHVEYYTTWRTRIQREESLSKKFQKEVWTISAEQREKLGRCWARLELDEKRSIPVAGQQKMRHFFRRQSNVKKEGSIPIKNSRIELNDFVIVSAILLHDGEDGEIYKPAVSFGHVREIAEDGICVECSDDLIATARSRRWTGSDRWIKDCLWRIDKDELSVGFSLARGNLEALFSSDLGISVQKLRELVVDLRDPIFAEQRQSEKHVISPVKDLPLNQKQRNVIMKASTAEDYCLLLGMPGTGKTDTIAAIIKRCVAMGESVLLTSFTHASVDNVLLRLQNLGVNDFLRLGHPSQVDSRLHGNMENPVSNLKEYESQVEGPRIVASTCLGIGHVLFSRRTFDVVIVDEAGQVSQMACIGPLLFSHSRFILIGDHFQLPPLSRMERGSAEEEESLFKRLCDAKPQAVTSLEEQYRMAEDIMRLSNQLVYGGAMKCGNEQVASQMLNVSDTLCVSSEHSVEEKEIFRLGETVPWLRKTLNPLNRVVFVETDSVNGYEEMDKGRNRESDSCSMSRINQLEASFVLGVCASLVLRGVKPSDIGIISPYRAQVALIRKGAKSFANGIIQDVDVKSIDQFQGCDKQCILISFVRSNPSDKVGQLLRDWRRINVALTRAKAKMILVGSGSTLRGGHKFLRRLMDILQEEKWIVPASPMPFFEKSLASEMNLNASWELPMPSKFPLVNDMLLNS